MSELDALSLDFAFRHPDSFARVLGRGTPDEADELLEELPPSLKATIIARLPATHVRQLLGSARHRPAEWLVDASFDDAVTLLSRIPREQRLSLVNSLDDRDRKRRLLRHQQYPAHSVGALVADIPLRLVADSLASDALTELRELDADARGPIIIVDAEGLYLGVLDRWRLLLRSQPAGKVEDYLAEVTALYPETPVAAAAMAEEWDTQNWLPVADHRQRVLGAVSRARVMRATGGSQRGDILLDLLADLTHFCEAVLVAAVSRRKVS